MFPTMSGPIIIIIYSGNIQGTFREHSGNIQGTFREHSGNIQGSVLMGEAGDAPPFREGGCVFVGLITCATCTPFGATSYRRASVKPV